MVFTGFNTVFVAFVVIVGEVPPKMIIIHDIQQLQSVEWNVRMDNTKFIESSDITARPFIAGAAGWVLVNRGYIYTH